MRASDPSLRMANQAAGLWVLLMGVSLLWMNDYQVLILGTVAISAMAGVGMNVLLGLSGQISLGHAAFYAIGAYASTLIAMKWELNFYGASVLASLIAGLFLLKGSVLFAIGRSMRLPMNELPLFVLLLAQGGEFAFVLLGVAASQIGRAHV